MNSKHLTDAALLNGAEKLAGEERAALTNLLHHLREIERRRLYSSLKRGSLFDYVVQDLKYSEDQASRRINAMRLMRDVPEIEHKIAQGSLSLTNMNLAQALFSKEKKSGNVYSAEQKAQVLMKLENQPTREAQKIVARINPEMKKRELSFNEIQDEVLMAKLIKIKGKYAHTSPHMTLNELLHKLCDKELAEKPQKTAAPRVKSQAHVRRQVWKRDQNKCTNCDSTHALEIDHRVPQAAGGPSTLENMRLLCRACNQRAAIEYFGARKMSRYLREPTARYAAGGLTKSSFFGQKFDSPGLRQ